MTTDAADPQTASTEAGSWADVPGPAIPVPEPGLWPGVRAGLWATVASTFRICVFILGALMLAWIAGLVGSLAIWLVAMWTGVMPFGNEIPAWAKSGTIGASQAVIGPVTSLFVALGRIVVVAYVGAHVPVRTAQKSTYPIERIRLWVAGIGGAAVAVLWFVPLSYDPILAIGMLLLPVAWVIGAYRGPAQPRVAKGCLVYVGLAALFLIAELAQIGLLVAAAQMDPIDASAVGLPTTAIGVAPQDLDVSVYWGTGSDTVGDTRVFWPSGVDPSTLLASVQTEIWPVQFDGLRPVLGPSAILVERHEDPYPFEYGEWTTPIPKAPQPIATFVVGMTPDGRRIVLGPGPQVQVTPQWWGSAVGFFVGG